MLVSRAVRSLSLTILILNSRAGSFSPTILTFSGTNLGATCLNLPKEYEPPSDEKVLAAGLEVDGDHVVGWRTARSVSFGDTQYVVGNCYEAPFFSICDKTKSHPGLYFASLEWLKENYPNETFVKCKCLKKEMACGVDRWRAKRLWIVE